MQDMRRRNSNSRIQAFHTLSSKTNDIKQKTNLIQRSFGKLSHTRSMSSPYQSHLPKTSKKLLIENKLTFKDYIGAKSSKKSKGMIKAYAANTYKGLVRDYNEDRVSIILNIARPKDLKKGNMWPVCSFFGVYDGHAGSACADFLRDNLHHFVHFISQTLTI